ncbi:MAG TPA: cell wall hydrolase [Sphingomicrobium sp.]
MTADPALEFLSRLLPADCRRGPIPWHRRALPLLPALLAVSLPALAASAAPEPNSAVRRAPSLAAPEITPASPLPLLLRNLSREAAIETNRSIPFADVVKIPAQPFHFTGDKVARERALTCLAAAIYYEAGNEDEAGQQAVAQVVLNRVRNSAFPASICGVIFQGSTLPTGCQFTFTCDGSLLRIPDRRAWNQALTIADAALSGRVFAPVGLSTHYHADYVVPYWATSLEKDAQIGTHIFYSWPRTWAGLNNFSARYAGRESDPTLLRTAAIMAHGALPPRTDETPRSSIEIATDPQVELVGVVAILAGWPGDKPSAYDTEARAFFKTVGGHFAVQLVRDSHQQGVLPDAALLKTSLNNFAQDGDFGDFFDSHSRYYRAAVDKARGDAADAVAAWERYTAVTVGPKKLSLAVGFTDESAVCLAKKVTASDRVWSWSPDATGTAADIFTDSGLSSGILDSKRLRIPAPLEEQIVRAVFARAAALAVDEMAGQQAVRREADRGYSLVPELADRLRKFETNRAQYPTLRDFLPVLIANLPARDPLAPAPPERLGCKG